MRLVLPAVALAGVVASVAMVLAGLPEATPAQSVLLELSSLPLSASVAAGILLLHRSASRPVGPRSRRVLAGAGAALGFGLVLMLWAYLVGPRGLVHSGQLLVWLGLVAALLVMIRRQPRRRATRFSLLDAAADADPEDDSADPELKPSL
jgi:peptidoglycan/LPS O-acetylase OafA/YrhL